MLQSSHPTWKTCNFVIYFSRPGKCLEFAQKVGKTSQKNYIENLVFQDLLFKMSLTKKKNHLLVHLHLFHIYIINRNTVILSQIDLEFHCFYLEITWKIHGIINTCLIGVDIMWFDICYNSPIVRSGSVVFALLLMIQNVLWANPKLFTLDSY